MVGGGGWAMESLGLGLGLGLSLGLGLGLGLGLWCYFVLISLSCRQCFCVTCIRVAPGLPCKRHFNISTGLRLVK